MDTISCLGIKSRNFVPSPSIPSHITFFPWAYVGSMYQYTPMRLSACLIVSAQQATSFPALLGRIATTFLYPLFSIASSMGIWYQRGLNLSRVICDSIGMFMSYVRV